MSDKDTDAANAAASSQSAAPAAPAADAVTDTAADEAQKAWDEFDTQDRANAEKEAGAAGSDGDDATSAAPGQADKTDNADADQKGAAKAAPAGQEKAGAEQEDIWATAPEPLRKAHEEQAKRLKDLEHFKNSQSGRIAAADRKLRALEAKLKAYEEGGAAPAAPADQKNADTKTNADKPTGDPKKPARNPDLAKVEEEYPEIAKPLIELIEGQKKVIDGLKGEVAALSGRAAHDDTEALVRAETALLDEAHSDWRELTGEPTGKFATEEDRRKAADEFNIWLSTQPQFVKEAALANGEKIVDAEAAKVLVGLYKAHRESTGQAQKSGQTTQTGGQPRPATANPNPNPNDARRRAQLESAATPRGPAKGGPTTVAIPADDRQAAWDAFERAGM